MLTTVRQLLLPKSRLESSSTSLYSPILLMPLPKLLWITNHAAVEALDEWQKVLSDLAVSSVADLAGAQAVLAGEDVDCVLVRGPIPDAERTRMVEALHDIDAILPVVFYDPEMTAAEAV